MVCGLLGVAAMVEVNGWDDNEVEECARDESSEHHLRHRTLNLVAREVVADGQRNRFGEDGVAAD